LTKAASKVRSIGAANRSISAHEPRITALSASANNTGASCLNNGATWGAGTASRTAEKRGSSQPRSAEQTCQPCAWRQICRMFAIACTLSVLER